MLRYTFLLVVLMTFAATCVFSQTRWFKYEQNPVMDVGSAGTWEGNGIIASRVIFQDSLYRMWYLGFGAGDIARTGHATSRDGVTWTKDTLNPVLSQGPPGSWESRGAATGYVVFTGSSYKMWYAGLDNASIFRIGYATSPDGRSWTKAASNPILGPGSWYSTGPTIPSVLPDSLEGFRMWFGAENAGHYLQIGYATAPDETTWTVNAGPVLSTGIAGSWEDRNVFGPRVLYDGLLYEMWYGGERSDFRSHFGYATSFDGINWAKSADNPVFPRGPAPWETNDIAHPQVLSDGGLYHMWYSGNPESPWRIGYAISPKGLAVSASTTDSVINSTDDTISVTVRVDDPSGLQFSAKILSGGTPVDTVDLFDDGAHGDSLAGDGVFANDWIPISADVYSVDLVLKLRDTLTFEMKNAAVNLVTAVGNAEFIAPQGYHLSHNFPNPFNPSTEINFSLPQRSHVTLKIFGLLGQEVTTLVSDELPSGSYSTKWDAAGMPSGVYFSRLQVGDPSPRSGRGFVETKKLLLLR